MRYWRLALLTVIIFFIALGSGRDIEGNGGAIAFQDRLEDYFVTVSVSPPEPTPGVVFLSVVVQAVPSENGSTNATPVPIATELRLTGRGPGPDGEMAGPFEPSPIVAGLSHFDVPVVISQAGVWVFRVEIFGPIGDVAVDVPVEIGSPQTPVAEPEDGSLRGPSWSIMGLTIAVLALGVGALGLGRRRRNRKTA